MLSLVVCLGLVNCTGVLEVYVEFDSFDVSEN